MRMGSWQRSGAGQGEALTAALCPSALLRQVGKVWGPCCVQGGQRDPSSLCRWWGKSIARSFSHWKISKERSGSSFCPFPEELELLRFTTVRRSPVSRVLQGDNSLSSGLPRPGPTSGRYTAGKSSWEPSGALPVDPSTVSSVPGSDHEKCVLE